jgi:hypothetical protein
MLMVNMSAPMARCRCSISGYLSTRLLSSEIPPEMAPNFGCTDLMVLSGRYQASALRIEIAVVAAGSSFKS